MIRTVRDLIDDKTAKKIVCDICKEYIITNNNYHFGKKIGLDIKIKHEGSFISLYLFDNLYIGLKTDNISDLLEYILECPDQIIDFKKFLGLCGCGYDTNYLFIDYLLELQKDFDDRREFNEHDDIYLQLLEKLDMTEHGGSVGGSWLTELGENFLKTFVK